MMKKYGVVGLVLVAVVCVVVVRSKVGRSKVEGAGGTTQPSPAATAGKQEGIRDAEPVPPENQSSESAQSVDPLSAPVQALLLEDGREHNYATLLAEIGMLGKELSVSDAAALMEMLAWPNDRFPEQMRPIEINAVKNDVLDKLLRQTTLPEGLGLHMVEMAQNAENDPVWRDYCFQFMDPLYERVAAEGMAHGAKDVSQAARLPGADEGRRAVGGTNQGPQDAGGTDELNAIREAMYAALDVREHTLAGTALIGLENLSRTHDEFDKQLIAEKAVSIASDEMVSMESRLTALRLSASGNLKPETGNLNLATANAARALAQTGETVYMRSAAIVTLGEVGSEEDRELLESFALDQDRQIAAAAKKALAKMDERAL